MQLEHVGCNVHVTGDRVTTPFFFAEQTHKGCPHNKGNPSYYCNAILGRDRGSVKVTCVRKMADAAALYCVFYLY